MTPQELQEESKRQWLNFAEQSFIGMKLPTSNSSGFMGTNITKSTIDNLLKSPYTNYKTLQSYSQLFMTKEGMYFRLVKLLASMLTYDYFIYPNIEPNAIKGKKKQLKDSYSKASIYLEKMNIKENATKWAEDFIRDGECYYYKIEDSNGIVYEKIDNKYCLPYRNENDVYKYAIDMTAISSVNDITTYPIEIQKALELFKADKNNPNFILGQYYPVKSGFCFTTVNEAKHGVPPFAFLFGDLISLENKKELKDQLDVIGNTRMIHSKIDTSNKETTVDPTVAKKYNDAIKNNLVQRGLDGVFAITNPFDSEVLNLNNNTSTNDLLTSSIEAVYSEIGISSLIFTAGKSAEALKRVVTTTGNLMVNMFMYKLNDYINYELKNISAPIKMLCKVLDTNIYEKETVMKNAKDSLSVGGSRLYYLATCSFTPMQSMNLLEMEQNVLGIDNIMKAQETSYTMSKNSSDNGSGRKSSEEIQSEGGETSEITSQVNEGK